MYAPYKNTFKGSHTCSSAGDPCGTDAECAVSCAHPGENVPTRCLGSAYLKQRHMGACYPAFARVGDACTVGEYPDCNNARGAMESRPPGPALFCEETIYVDPRPNTSPSFAAPEVGRGYCVPVADQRAPRTATSSWIQTRRHKNDHLLLDFW